MTLNVSRFLIKWGVSDIIRDNLVQCDNVNIRQTNGKNIAYTDFKKPLEVMGTHGMVRILHGIGLWLTAYL